MSITLNHQIASQLEVLARSLAGKSGKDRWRAKTYFNGAKLIREYSKPIESGEQAREEIKGVGKTIAERIDEYLKSRSVMLPSRQESVMPDFDKASVIQLFEGIHGVGEVTASEWYNQGYRTLEDLAVVYPNMNAAQQLGYKYYLQLKLRVPRSEIDCFQRLFEHIISDYEFQICGSYRRGHRTSGDIDVLVKGRDELENETILAGVVKRLTDTGFIRDKLSLGPKKFMGIIRLSAEHNHRRLDIMITTPEKWGAGLLYFTGCGSLNVQMRELARSKDMRLNERGLWLLGPDGSDKEEGMTLVDAKTEEEIFDHLGLDYLEPEDRDI